MAFMFFDGISSAPGHLLAPGHLSHRNLKRMPVELLHRTRRWSMGKSYSPPTISSIGAGIAITSTARPCFCA
jgi:hypothetical protein